MFFSKRKVRICKQERKGAFSPEGIGSMYCSKYDTVLIQHQSCGGMGKTHVLTECNHLIHLSTNAEFKVCAHVMNKEQL